MSDRPFRVLVTGSQSWTDLGAVWSTLDALLFEHPGMVLRHGKAPKGGDQLAEAWAQCNGVAEEPYPADWLRLGRGAGMIRNRQMVDAGADLCLAFINPCDKPDCPRRPHGSHGASHCADLAERAGIETRRYPFDEGS